MPTCRLTVVGGRGKRHFHSPQQQIYAVPVVNLHLCKMKCSVAIGARGNFCILPVLLVCMNADSQKHPKKSCRLDVGFCYALGSQRICPIWWCFSCWQDACRAGAGGRGKSSLRVRHVGGGGALSQET